MKLRLKTNSLFNSKEIKNLKKQNYLLKSLNSNEIYTKLKYHNLCQFLKLRFRRNALPHHPKHNLFRRKSSPNQS